MKKEGLDKADPGVEAAKVPGVIPHFFFDAIGRIVPGGFFLVGLAWTVSGMCEEILSICSTEEKTVSWSGTELVLFSLLLVVAAYFLGFLLGSLSQPIVEKVLFKRRPLDLKWLREWMGTEQGKAPVEEAYEKVFRSNLADDRNLLYRQSWLCAYYVWQNNQNLGLMGSRWDAEALSSQSTVLASIILIIITLLEWPVGWVKVVIFGAILVGALFGYSYHRKKRLVGRFDLFLAVRKLRESHGL